MTSVLTKSVLWMCLFLVSAQAASAWQGSTPATALIQGTVAGVQVTCIAIRLSDPRVAVRVGVCKGFPRSDESFSAMIERLRPVAAMTGAYWSTTTKKPIGDIVLNGRVMNRGCMGTALAISKDGVPSIRRVPWGRTMDWRGYSTVLACGPALVLDGQIDVDPAAEGFQDGHIMTTTARMAAGYTADHVLLFVEMSPVTFGREARVMKALGCVGAMNLDAGASTALYYRGRYLTVPTRRLSNILCVYER